MEAVFFATPDAFRAWLVANHETADEQLVGYFKKGTGHPSITWPESVDQALCVGWIDGVRRRVDDERYSIRFTPRRARSIWSAVNIRRFGELDEAGLVLEAGRRAFAKRTEDRSAIYSDETTTEPALSPESEERFRANEAAWAYFSARAPSYRRAATHWATSAKKSETRKRRLERLIADSAAGQFVPPLRWTAKQ